MLKETISYTDFLGNERTEDFRFNLTEAELMEMELGTTGGFTEYVNKIRNKIIKENLKEISKKETLSLLNGESKDPSSSYLLFNSNFCRFAC